MFLFGRTAIKKGAKKEKKNVVLTIILSMHFFEKFIAKKKTNIPGKNIIHGRKESECIDNLK